MTTILKNSDEWLKELFPDCQVLDPDGWDRKNFDISWAEKITKKEFSKRFMYSTVILTKEAAAKIQEKAKKWAEQLPKPEAKPWQADPNAKPYLGKVEERYQESLKKDKPSGGKSANETKKGK